MFRSKKGMSLIEVMVSVLVFMIGIGGVLSVILTSRTMAKRSDMAYTAYNLAKNHIDTLKSMAFSDLSSANETSTVTDETGTPDVTGLYVRDTVITTSYSGDSNLTQADVTVYYIFRGVQSATPMQMTTVIYNGG